MLERSHSPIQAVPQRLARVVAALVLSLSMPALGETKNGSPDDGFNDSHVHLTNYIQEGVDVHDFLKLMGNRVGRSVLFGIPLQQSWSYRVSGKDAPTYYLDADSPLYYYSFTDAFIALQYKSLTPAEQARFEPMITGFNPTDMYATDHVRRVLKAFPGVFTGIGEFTIHKEFVSAKVAGEVASLTDPALDRLLDFAGEVGLVTLLHNDFDAPFSKPGEKPEYLSQAEALFARHPRTTIIWAHMGLGRVVHPAIDQVKTIEGIIEDPKLQNVYFDLSWLETAKYIVASSEATRRCADLINRHPDRFLFGTDEVAPAEPDKYFKIFETYQPLWKLLKPETSEKVRKKNFERLFDAARAKVRAWEKANLK